MTIDGVVDELRTSYVDPACRNIDEDCLVKWCDQTGLKEDQLLDAVALRLASGFYSRELGFSFCSDTIARLVTITATRWPLYFYEVYIAFDAGEFYHDENRDIDPSESHARPMIEALLKEKGMSEFRSA